MVADGVVAVKILVVDTALGEGHAGLVVDGLLVSERCLAEPRRLAEYLVPAIEEVLREGATPYSELDRIAVTVGPGTFTGLRIGLAAARAIALASGCPVVGLSTLEVLAHGAAELIEQGEIVVGAVNARRGQIYCQAFEKTGAGFGPIDDARAAFPESVLPDFVGKPGIIVGDGAHRLSQAGDCGALRPMDDDSTSRIDVGVLGRLAQGIAPGDAVPAPLYLREPDAKLPS